jgi:hypothetical protein
MHVMISIEIPFNVEWMRDPNSHTPNKTVTETLQTEPNLRLRYIRELRMPDAAAVWASYQDSSQQQANVLQSVITELFAQQKALLDR